MGPPCLEEVLTLDREHQGQLTQVFQMLDSDRDGLLTLEECQHAAHLLGCQLSIPTPDNERVPLPLFLHSLRRKTAELPEHALNVLASRFFASVRVQSRSVMKAEDLRRFFLESAENIPVSRLQDVIDAMDCTLEGEGCCEENFIDFVDRATEAAGSKRT